jgi:hypothetical protein
LLAKLLEREERLENRERKSTVGVCWGYRNVCTAAGLCPTLSVTRQKMYNIGSNGNFQKKISKTPKYSRSCNQFEVCSLCFHPDLSLVVC